MKRSELHEALGACVLAAALLCAGEASAEVRVARIFGDRMVLQRDMAVPVWGWAKPGEKVAVSFGGQEKSAMADGDGKWMVRLGAMPASATSREMTVVGQNTVRIKDVLVGEVWLCGGQSNMEMEVRDCLGFDWERRAATNSDIRQIKVAHLEAFAPLEDLDDSSGQWTVCSGETVGRFTAAGYFFARRIAKELDVPVGLINDNWGGTRIEPWTPPEGFRIESSEPEIGEIIQKVDSATASAQEAYRQYLARLKEWIPAAEAVLAAKRMPPSAPKPPAPYNRWTTLPVGTFLFNGMITPVVPYAIRGVLWYQGEENGDEGPTYLHKMKALIGGWRQVWGEGDFPFYFVQLAGFQSPNQPAGSDGWARLREAQLQALSIPNTGMVVTADIGEDHNIHPKNKQDVGERLALWALAKTYGKDLVFSGPIFRSQTIGGDKIRISFDYVDGGLTVGEKNGLEPVREVQDGKLKWFLIAGQDRVWHRADAVIDGQTVVISSERVSAPVAVRYAFMMLPGGANLYNKAGLPASPFRTDDW